MVSFLLDTTEKINIITIDMVNMEKEELATLYDISQIINSILDIGVLLNKVMDLVIETTGAERGFLMLKENGKLKTKVARNIDKRTIETEISNTVVNKVFSSGESLLTSDAKADPRFSSSDSVFLYNITSILSCPLVSKGKTIGVIYVDSITKKKVFTTKNLNFLQGFSNIAAISIENANLTSKLKEENVVLKRAIGDRYSFKNIVGKNKKFKEILNVIERIIDSKVSILLEGESGTGKELLARAIHNNSQRNKKEFVACYCGAMPETLLESELFGYKKGAFTGAYEDKKGLFEEAHLGTFFLDEVSEIPPKVQVKLLRVLQDGEVRRLGETKSRNFDVRLISATNKNLEDELKTGKFREDLFYRLKVVKITLPPLRERKDDIPILADHFLRIQSKESGKSVTKISNEAIRALVNYLWPGNVRELGNAIHYAVTMARAEEITLEDLPANIVNPAEEVKSIKKLKEWEKEIILRTFKECNYAKVKTARVLGISQRTLHSKLKKYKQGGDYGT